MGIYLNPGNEKFQMDLTSEIYIDKSNMIQYTNRVLRTARRFVCVSRPRRFGKSMAVNMLAAYYGRECDSEQLFRKLKLSASETYRKHLNQYDVIVLNMQEFLSRTTTMEEMLTLLKNRLLWEIFEAYSNYRYFDKEDLISCLQNVYQNSKIPFVFIIDEWDCVFREYKKDIEAQKQYLDFLRDLLKDRVYVGLAYMTGILPIKKYGTHSALNMFDEFSMVFPGPFAEYAGFTQNEVECLCRQYHMSFDETREWYDGYYLKGAGEVYNPKSVVSCMQFQEFGNYWNQTENYEALQMYIDMNLEGLRDDIIAMMQGEYVDINIGTFANDMTTFVTKDDVMTLLVHLGYLGYDSDAQKVFIPNQEILNEFGNAVRTSEWGEVSKALKLSKKILQAIWDGENEIVARGMEESHFETSQIQYNDENALSYTISLALYAARNYYTIIRELPTGKGFADLVYLPKKKHWDKPALLVELKWDKSAHGAMEQIKQKEYVKALKEYQGDLLLVGINYDKSSKKHECQIEAWKMEKRGDSSRSFC